MKKILQIRKTLFTGLFATALVSCVSIEEDPESFLTSDQFYHTESQCIAGVNAIYNGLANSNQTMYNRLLHISMEMATDDYVAGPRARNAHVRAISGLTHDSSNDRMQALWGATYDVINRANIAIDKIEANTDINPQLRLRLMNEAKFIRALMYFNLVRWFGGVPLILHETTSLTSETLFVTKGTEAEVYEQIIKDLTDAENLPGEYGSAETGRATSGAATSLLAKVYLTREDWQNAVLKSKQVIDSHVYELFDDFADVFNVATKNGKEHIFSAQFKGYFNWNGNFLAATSAPNTVPGINGDYGDAVNAESGLYESFADNDERKAITFITEIVSPVDGQLYTFEPHMHKYYDETTPASPGQSSKNTPLIRYAEILLIYAEALGQLQGPVAEAYWAVDEVRTRAGLDKLADISPGLSKEDFREAVYEERRKELVYEYQRWFDLVRRGPEYYTTKLHEAGKTNAASRHVHFPTPQRELDINPNLTQHPDWVGY